MRAITFASALVPALALAGIAIPAAAQSPMSAKEFVAKAGASDKFEITEAQMMLASSKNTQVRDIAQRMITDHTDSTAKIKSAAMADGLHPLAPVLTSKQMANIASLRQKQEPGKDALYLQQQVPAHQEALTLMQNYASMGTSPSLKSAAAGIAPVVQGHLTMVQSAQSAMPAAM